MLYIILGRYEMMGFLMAFGNIFINPSLLPFLFLSSTHKQKPLPFLPFLLSYHLYQASIKRRSKKRTKKNGLEC